MRRYRILFIDDEELMRESFQKLIHWEEHQFEVVGIFNDGESAWEYLKEHDVDIVITDINMPFMNGIDLLEHIRKNELKMRVLFLTGYEYFEYAHKAVQLQAFDFLLKPLTTEKLLKAVERAAFDIEKEEAAMEAMGMDLDIRRREFVKKLLYGNIEKDQIRTEAELVKLPVCAGSWLTIMATIDTLEGKKLQESEGAEIKNRLQEKILEKKCLMEEQTGEAFQIYFARTLGIHIQMILVSERKQVFTQEWINVFFEILLSIESEFSEYRVTFVVGKSRNLIEELQDSFVYVRHAADHRHILKGKGWKLLYASDLQQERKEEQQVILPTDTFLYHIRMGMTEEVADDVKKIYEQFRYKEFLSLESAKMVTTELAITAFKGEIAFQDESVSYLYYLNHIQQLSTLEEMEEDILQFSLRIAEKRKQGGNHKRKIAEQALNYLKEHYNKEDLSLNEVAEYLNISVPYLAVLFKQETKKNFGAHLSEIRMEKAKELLRTTSDTVSEIAEKTGYNSAQYFAVCFKKYTGSSPGTYRNQLKDISS